LLFAQTALVPIFLPLFAPFHAPVMTTMSPMPPILAALMALLTPLIILRKGRAADAEKKNERQ
jgi:hypothetical protein